jgi:hypothetical protein
MSHLSSKLNLADHDVCMGGEPVARSTVCGDIEVHRLQDNSVFMFSAHRLFPTAGGHKAIKCVGARLQPVVFAHLGCDHAL